MNPILQKVLEELNKPKPNKAYIKGMVETLLSFQNQPITGQHTGTGGYINASEVVPIPTADDIFKKPIKIGNGTATFKKGA